MRNHELYYLAHFCKPSLTGWICPPDPYINRGETILIRPNRRLSYISEGGSHTPQICVNGFSLEKHVFAFALVSNARKAPHFNLTRKGCGTTPSFIYIGGCHRTSISKDQRLPRQDTRIGLQRKSTVFHSSPGSGDYSAVK